MQQTTEADDIFGIIFAGALWDNKKGVYLENINLILAFIIYIISQPIELLNIYSAFIVYQYGNARGTFCYNR